MVFTDKENIVLKNYTIFLILNKYKIKKKKLFKFELSFVKSEFYFFIIIINNNNNMFKWAGYHPNNVM